MKAVSIRDLHIRTSEFVRDAAEGAVVVIERRGVPVAELRPLSESGKMTQEKKRQVFQSMQKLWGRLPQSSDSTTILEEDRNR